MTCCWQLLIYVYIYVKYIVEYIVESGRKREREKRESGSINGLNCIE